MSTGSLTLLTLVIVVCRRFGRIHLVVFVHVISQRVGVEIDDTFGSYTPVAIQEHIREAA